MKSAPLQRHRPTRSRRGSFLGPLGDLAGPVSLPRPRPGTLAPLGTTTFDDVVKVGIHLVCTSHDTR